MLRFALLLPPLLASAANWPTYGGPHRDFTADSKGLANTWPAGGPKQLWSRELGDGYSGIAVDDGKLYTMYRRGNDEVAIALDAKTGTTLWEDAHTAPFDPQMMMEAGPGPHVTPTVVGDRVFTIGILGYIRAFDKNSGKLLWSKDTRKEFPDTIVAERGYASTPLPYKSTLLVPLGGKGQAMVALNQRDGSLAWKSGSFLYSPSSPILIHLGGQEQVVMFSAAHVLGMDPNDGKILWSHPHKTDYNLNIALPVWGEDGVLVISSAYGGGARGLQLKRDAAGQTTVEELWAHKKFRVHHGTMIRIGDLVWGSSGDFGPTPLTAVEAKTGKIVVQDRQVKKSNFVYADGKLILVEDDGTLAMATVSADGVKLLAQALLLKSVSWTAPSLVGSILYVRDRHTIMALDLH